MDQALSGWIGLVGLLVLTLVVGGIAAWATLQGVRDWYPGLRKPAFNPPNALFAPVWTVLYVLMAIAAWRVAPAAGLFGPAMLLFYLQLALNAGWSFLFFKARLVGPALAELVVLFLAVAATTIAFWQVDAVAGGLLLPYLAWVGFAGALNAAIWRLNG